jgi:hypothetical protein
MRKIVQLIEYKGDLLALDNQGYVWRRVPDVEKRWKWRLHSFNVPNDTNEELLERADRGD